MHEKIPVLLSVNEVARWLEIARSTLYKWILEGLFPRAPIRLPGGRPRWPEPLVAEWIRRHRVDDGGSQAASEQPDSGPTRP